MAKKFIYNVGSVSPESNDFDGQNCGICSVRLPRPRWGFQYDYATGLIIDQRGAYDFEDHGEVLVCSKCEPKFHPDTILEV